MTTSSKTSDDGTFERAEIRQQASQRLALVVRLFQAWIGWLQGRVPGNGCGNRCYHDARVDWTSLFSPYLTGTSFIHACKPLPNWES